MKDHRAIKREQEEFKAQIDALVTKAQHVLEEGWTMKERTSWPQNNM